MSLNPDIYSGTIYTDAINGSIKSLINSGQFIIVAGKVVPFSFEQAQTFYKLFSKNEGQVAEHSDLSLPFTLLDGGIGGGGTDAGITFWEFSGRKAHTTFIAVISPFGKVLACFSYDSITPRVIRSKTVAEGKPVGFENFIDPVILVSPKGDIFFMVGHPDQIKFYSVKRTW
jgi:hypothetical protein